MASRFRSSRIKLILFLRSVASRLWGIALAIEPIDQLSRVAGETGQWEASGDDPKFACLTDGYPLRAGWYEFSMELQGKDDDRLAPMFYFDYGNGMHETWSLQLSFMEHTARHQTGVILLVFDVHGLRFDPASTPCTFHLDHLKLRRLGRMGASWRMYRAVSRDRTSSGQQRQALLSEAWKKLKGPGGRRAFASWLYGLYVRRGIRGTTYDRWLRLYGNVAVPKPQHSDMLVSVLLPTYNTPPVWLRRCIDSVVAQTYPNWELCIADDASTAPEVRAVLEEYVARDSRIRVSWRERNGHISAASNTALAMARGDYVALLDHDDELHGGALAAIVDALMHNPQWQLVYSDEDKIDEDGHRYEPYFKPDWNPDLLCGQNFISHLGVYSRALVQAVGGFCAGFEGSQDWDLALRCSERLQPHQIGHIPVVLYHWRAIAGSTAQGVDQKHYAHDAGRRAVREHLARCGKAAEVIDIDGLRGVFRVRHPLPHPLSRVSIIVPTRDHVDLLRRCVDSILQRTTYPDYEVIIVDNQSAERASHAYFATFNDHPIVRMHHHDRPFNYSIINNQAVQQCTGELICLLNNDVEVISPGWLEELASHALRAHVGAVGAMLYYPNDTIQHAGVITGIHGVAAHPYSGMPRGHGGQMARARLAQAMSAVTAACMMVRRDVYCQAGGLDPLLEVAFNDIDFCLRLSQRGYTNLWTPFAELYHHESATRGHDSTPEKSLRFAREVAFMKHRWGAQLERDPAYNPNLTLSGEPFTLAFPPRAWKQSSGERHGDAGSTVAEQPASVSSVR